LIDGGVGGVRLEDGWCGLLEGLWLRMCEAGCWEVDAEGGGIMLWVVDKKGLVRECGVVVRGERRFGQELEQVG